MAIASRPSLANSAFTKLMSNSALWMTSLEIADEGEKLVNDACEDWLVLKDGGGMAVDARGVLGDLALGIDERVEDFSRQDLMDDFDRANFQHPVSVGRTKASRFGVEHDFTHSELGLPRAPQQRA